MSLSAEARLQGSGTALGAVAAVLEGYASRIGAADLEATLHAHGLGEGTVLMTSRIMDTAGIADTWRMHASGQTARAAPKVGDQSTDGEIGSRSPSSLELVAIVIACVAIFIFAGGALAYADRDRLRRRLGRLGRLLLPPSPLPRSPLPPSWAPQVPTKAPARDGADGMGSLGTPTDHSTRYLAGGSPGRRGGRAPSWAVGGPVEWETIGSTIASVFSPAQTPRQREWRSEGDAVLSTWTRQHVAARRLRNAPPRTATAPRHKPSRHRHS